MVAWWLKLLPRSLSPGRPTKGSLRAMPESSLKAVIWDMDGVIANTATCHFKSWRRVFKKRNIEFTEGDFKNDRRNIIKEFYFPYFSAIKTWYENLRIGRSSKRIFNLLQKILGE
jgi:phosphoglycolate phosphatase-like HAD superfamily hydrolase